MNEANDAELLRQYAEQGSETAFAALVQRHLGLVYSSALRRARGDAHLAAEVSQRVFVALAREARALQRHPLLAGWLYTATRHAAHNAMRDELRRRAREQEAFVMQEINREDASGETDWTQLRPAIDAAMDDLPERDRHAVLLRYFEGRPFAQVGAALGVGDDAARMRVDRALEKLRTRLARRGVGSTAAALALALTGNSVTAAPPALAEAIARSAATAGAAGRAGSAGIGFGWLVGAGKLAAGFAIAVTLVVGTLVSTGGRRSTSGAGKAAVESGHAIQKRNDDLAAELAAAQRRAAEAERDNGELLAAIEALRLAQRNAPAVAVISPTLTLDEASQRLIVEREFQQLTAKLRHSEAVERARWREAALIDRATRRFDGEKMLIAAEELYRQFDLKGAVEALEMFRDTQPSDPALLARAKQLAERLEASREPVAVPLVSDGQTWVMIVLGGLPPSRIQMKTIELLPGNYELLGRRPGYESVNFVLQVRAGVPMAPVAVVCSVPAIK